MKARYWSRNRKNKYNISYGYTTPYEILKSGYTVLQTMKALSKAWLGYTIAKNKGEHERLQYYVSVKSTISGKISAYRYR